MTDKIFVIGASGMLGAATVRLLSQTRSIVELRRSNSNKAPLSNETRLIDLFEPRSLVDALNGAKTILFFPAFSAPSISPRDIRGELEVSASALANLIEAAAATSCRPHIVFPSTGGAIYGNSDFACTEQTAAAPESSYAFGKLISEEILKFYSRTEKASFTILRFSNLYGLRGQRLSPQGVIDRFLDDALEGRVSSVWSEPSSTRDYLFVDDAANAIKGVLDQSDLAKNETFNVASGISTSMRDLLLMVRSVTNGKHRFEYDSSKYAGVQSIAVDASKFRGTFPEWGSPTSIAEGLSITWQRKSCLTASFKPCDQKGEVT